MVVTNCNQFAPQTIVFNSFHSFNSLNSQIKYYPTQNNPQTESLVK